MAARLRVVLGDSIVASAPKSFWWQPTRTPPLGTVSDLVAELVRSIGCRGEAAYFAVQLDGLPVLPGSAASVLRDGDEVVLTTAVAAPCKRPRSPSSSSAESSEATSSSSGSESEPSAGVANGQTQQERYHTPGDKLLSPSAAAAPTPGTASGDKGPSRSARRKAAKRRLKRLGLLPASAAAKKQKLLARGSGPLLAAAAVADPLNPNLALQRGRRKGAVTAYIRFADSEEEEEAQALPQVAVPARAAPPPAAVPPPAAPAPRAVAEPMGEAEFVQLRPVEGIPTEGDVVAYKLLEIGPSFAPQVSEVRMGKVVSCADDGMLTLAPHPDPTVHPLAYTRQQLVLQHGWEGGAEAASEEEDEEPPSAYDEHGVLSAELSSFAAVRWVQRGVLDEDNLDVGPVSYCKLGPPRPTAVVLAPTGTPIAAEGGWASLAEQLQRRREQLSAEKTAVPSAPSEPASAAAGTKAGSKARRAARQTALGPMLCMLRSNGTL